MLSWFFRPTHTPPEYATPADKQCKHLGLVRFCLLGHKHVFTFFVHAAAWLCCHNLGEGHRATLSYGHRQGEMGVQYKGHEKELNFLWPKWPVSERFWPQHPPEKVYVGPFLCSFPGNEARFWVEDRKLMLKNSMCFFCPSNIPALCHRFARSGLRFRGLGTSAKKRNALTAGRTKKNGLQKTGPRSPFFPKPSQKFAKCKTVFGSSRWES